jgi:hypothetical protein
MKKNLKILIILILTFTSYSTYSFSVVGKGPASVYEVSVKKVFLCEVGSTESNCVNRTLISNGAKTMDIAGVNPGATAASIGSLSKAAMGTTYTYIQVEMAREFLVKGNDGGCKTAGDGSLTTFGVGHGSNAAKLVKLYIPGTDTQGASIGNNISGYRSSDGRISAAGTVEDDDDLVWWRKIITGSLILTTGKIPTLDMKFDVSTGIEGNHTTCTNAHMNAAEPAITISFK